MWVRMIKENQKMVREKFCINFEVNKEGNLFTAENNNVTVMNCSVIDGMLDFWMLFDFAEDKPLHLKDCVNKRDKISINTLTQILNWYAYFYKTIVSIRQRAPVEKHKFKIA